MDWLQMTTRIVKVHIICRVVFLLSLSVVQFGQVCCVRVDEDDEEQRGHKTLLLDSC